jgi:hypothetical protein
MTKDFASIFAQIKRLEPNISELKIFHGQEEVADEAKILNEKINDLLSIKEKAPEFLRPLVQILSEHGVPVTAFPNV